MHFFKNIGVQLVSCDRSFRPKVAIMLKYQIEIIDNIFVFILERNLDLTNHEIGACWNKWGIKEMYSYVLELEYSENIFNLMSVFNELETCLFTVELSLLVFMKPFFGSRK